MVLPHLKRDKGHVNEVLDSAILLEGLEEAPFLHILRLDAIELVLVLVAALILILCERVSHSAIQRYSQVNDVVLLLALAQVAKQLIVQLLHGTRL